MSLPDWHDLISLICTWHRMTFYFHIDDIIHGIFPHEGFKRCRQTGTDCQAVQVSASLAAQLDSSYDQRTASKSINITINNWQQ